MEIKFRAYIPNLKWMVPVARINFDVGTVEVDLTDGNGDYAEYEFDEIELMQFTGLKDKKGVEIYEGDIVQHNFMKAKIVYGYCGFEFEWITPRVATIRNRVKEPIFRNADIIFEVIGNIHEYKELLEV